MDDDRDIREQMASADVETRRRAVIRLYTNMELYEKLVKHAYGFIKDHYLAQELVQEAYARLFQRVIEGGHAPIKNPAGFLWRTVENLARDYLRLKKSRLIEDEDIETLDEKRAVGGGYTLEEDWLKLEERETREAWGDWAMAMCLHMKHESDRVLMALRGRLGWSSQEVRCMTGWSTRRLHNDGRRVLREIRLKAKTGFDVWQPHPWHKAMAFTGDNTPIGITWPVQPCGLAPESEREIIAALGAHSMYEVQTHFAALLRIEAWDAPESRVALCYTRRLNYMLARVFDGAPIDYIDFTPHFHRVGQGRTWQTYLELRNPQSYQAVINKHTHNEVGDWIGWDMNIDKFGLKVRKYASQPLIMMLCQPSRRDEVAGVFRLYPLSLPDSEREDTETND